MLPSGWVILQPVSRFRLLALLPLVAVAACSEDDAVEPGQPPRYSPTAASLLSTASPTRDEDPSVLVARDGSIVVAWFSDRGGNNDIYVTRSARGTEWAPAVRVTTSADGDFYPNLIQDAAGVFHLTWFRWYALNRGSVWYNRSIDPLVWDANQEVQVTTTANVDDWVPSIAETPDSLRVFFVSEARDAGNATNEIYYASSHVDSMAFGPARAFPGNSPVAHDHLPFAAWTGSGLDLVWVRHDLSQPSPWLSPPPKSEIWHASTLDGVAWSPEFPVTVDAGQVVQIFPALYRRSNGEWRILWMTTRTGPAQVVELPLSDLDGYPGALIENTSVSPGYSHRATRTPVAGLHFAAWVQGPEGAQDVHYRFYAD
jgi:hypothetical protein